MRNIVFILVITNKLIALNKTTTNVNQKHSEWETELCYSVVYYK